jgi:uncharacterized membrane protein
LYWLLILARISHILAAVFWVGATMLQTLFLAPVLMSVEPSLAKQVVQGMRARGLRFAMTGSALVTVGSGIVLLSLAPGLAHVSALLGTAWGVSIATGAVAGVLMLLVALLGIEPRLGRLDALFAETRSFPAEQLRALSRQIILLALLELISGTVAVVSMAVARYA